MRSHWIKLAVLALFSRLLIPSLAHAQVVISEFMAANSNGIRDDDGNHSDWIEVFNMGSSPTTLDGWFLTDDQANLSKWRLPNGNAPLQPNSYTLFWASGRNRTNPEAPLHTNFKLAKEGGYLALVDPNTNVVSAFGNYPVQTADISYGRDRVDPNITGYFTTPTPNGQNTTSGSGFAPPPMFSHASGIYTNASISLVITSAVGSIRYSTDGLLPGSNATLYMGPIVIGTNATIKARVFPPAGSSLLPSEVVAKNYLFLDNTTVDFTSNLPLLIISTEGRSIGSRSPASGAPRTNGSVTIIDVKGSRSPLKGAPDLQVLAGLEYFGNTSVLFTEKKPIRFETQDALGNDLDVSILGLPAGSDFKLKNPYDDKTMLNDYLAAEFYEQMGHYSVRRRFLEAFVNTGGGRLNYTNDYYGILLLVETIKIGKDRVDVARIPNTATTEPTISGGYIFKKDLGDDLYFFTSGANGILGQRLAMHDPTPNELRLFPTNDSALTMAGSNQVNYLQSHLSRMEQVLYSNTWLTATGANHYASFLDVDSFVDWHWIVEFPKQIDGYVLSTYFVKPRFGKISLGPVWDYNLAFGNGNYAGGGQTNGWMYQNESDPWLSRLVAGDSDFGQKIADRWSVLRTFLFNGPRVLAHIDELAAHLNEAANRDLAKYKSLGVFLFGNPDGGVATGGSTGSIDGRDVDFVRPLIYYDQTTNSIIGQMKKYVLGRYLWIDSQFSPVPVINASDGMSTNGFAVTITDRPGAEIYYTTDGTDPRGPGGITNGTLYTGPISLVGNMGIVSRALETNTWKNTWSGPSRVTLYTSIPTLRITEIMYHPQGAAAGSTNNTSDFEYVEVKNIGHAPLNVNHFSIDGGIKFKFPNIVLEAGQSGVVVKNVAAFQSRYGTNNPSILILGAFTGELDDRGDQLILQGAVGEPILNFSYEDDWYPVTDGLGFSLVVADDSGPPESWGLQSKWRPSNSVGGSPGQANLVPALPPAVLVNEVLAHTLPATDAIELYNSTPNPVNIGGWFLSDDFAIPKKYVVPVNTIVPGFGFRIFYETNSFNFPTNAPASFALGTKGDDVWVFSGDGTNLTGYAHGFTFGASPLGRTLGRHVISTGEEHFVLQRSNSLGGTNAGPLVGPIVITEINAHPPELVANAPGSNNTLDEYVELQNITTESVPLYDPAFPTNSWRLHDAVTFSFPATNLIVPPGGFLLVVSFDPALDPVVTSDFRSRNAVPAGVPLFGPWTGHLDNASDNLELMQPDVPDPDGSVTYFAGDNVRYSTLAAWPNAWDGTGLTLQRVSPASYGNDPANWIALSPTPGTLPLLSGTPPIITSQPSDQIVPTGRELRLSVTATGTGLHYQWQRTGMNMPGETNSLLSLPNFQANEAGLYNVFVFNSAGSALGKEFTLSSRTGLQFLQQPVDRVTTNGGTTNFSVLAVGSGPVMYVWRLNGLNVNATNAIGATNETLTITNVQSFNEGTYTVTIADDYETFASTPVTLRLVFRPIFTVQPLSQPVVQGQPVTISAAVSGTAPMTFRWRKQSSGSTFVTLATNTGPLYSFLTLTNFQLSDATNYNVAVSNIVGLASRVPGGPAIGTSSNALLSLLVDTDHDGLPDVWEIGQQGFSINNPSDAARDDDHDGMSNLAEYIAGTDYLNPQSYLRVSIGIGGTATLSFLAVSNRTYSVLFSDGVPQGFSRKLTDVVAMATNRIQSVADSAPGTNRYYRLVTPVQP